MRSTSLCLSIIVSFFFTLFSSPSLRAGPPDVMTIVHEMQEVFEPERPRVRKIEITVSGESRLETRWVARKATKVFPDGKRTLLVLLDPHDVRGNAVLIQEQKGKYDVRWVYVPVVRRVRKLLPVSGYEPFLNTDFTYADLGFVDYSGDYRLLGQESLGGKEAYKLEFSPQNRWYYSRIVSWVSKDTHLPLKRDYFDLGGHLWKEQTLEKVTVIEGIPTPLRIVMKDVQNGTRSVFEVSEVRYDLDLPDGLFDPQALSRAAEAPFWEKLEPSE